MAVGKIIKAGRAIAKRKPREKTVSGARVDKGMPSLFKGKPGEYAAARDAKTKDIVKKRKLKSKVAAGVIVGGTGTAALIGAGGGKEDKKQTDSKKRKAEYAAHAKKQAAKKKKADAAKKKKTATAKKKKRRLLFGKNAIIRPFKGKIARVLLGEDEKFGGDKGLIDFLNTGGSVTGLSKAQQNMLKQAQQHARSTGQNPKALQDLVSKYGNQLKGGGRKGKLKGRPRPGGRRNGGEAIAPPAPRIRPPAPAPAAASGLSKAQQNLLRQAQQHSQSTGQNPAKLQALTAQHGNLMKRGRGAAAGARPNLPRPGGMKAGGLASKKGKPRGVGAATRGYGRAMKK